MLWAQIVILAFSVLTIILAPMSHDEPHEAVGSIVGAIIGMILLACAGAFDLILGWPAP